MRRLSAAASSTLIALVTALFATSACDGGGERLPIGAICGAPAQCESGICSEQLCIDPASCVNALAAATDPAFATACGASLGGLALSPDPAQVEPGGEVQFTLTGSLTSTTTSERGDGGVAPRPEGEDLETENFALSAAVDLTPAARFEATDPEAITFDRETPGLASVHVEGGSFTIIAYVGSGDLERSAEATLIVGGAEGAADETDRPPEGGEPDGGGD